jgi:uncharacterized protein YdeI (YjbR/CyaY-like superfamily)
MSIYNEKVTAYIGKAQPFLEPILNHLRDLVHKTNKDVEEKIKWGMPHFDYKGMYCGIAAMKQHCGFGFWKAGLLENPGNYIVKGEDAGMGSIGRLTTMKDLPPDKALIDFLKQAKEVNDNDVKADARPKKEKEELVLPDTALKALQKNKKANATFQKFSPSQQREYIEWIVEAKTDATRDKRLETMLQWLEEGKIRHWKYQTK